jgi:hypothetical protein
MARQIRTGSEVEWAWGKSTASGRVVTVHHSRVERDIEGAHVVRIGSQEDPVLEIKASNGNTVLKLRSEVEHD